MNINSIKKIIKYYLLVLLLAGIFLPTITQAQNDDKNCWTLEQCTRIGEGDWVIDEGCGQGVGGQDLGKCYSKFEPIDLQVSIPLDLGRGGVIESVEGFPEYLKYIYGFFTLVVGVIAVAYVAFGGYQWIIAAGSAEKISQAKATIQGALIGLLLAVGSYVILGMINTRLVNFKDLRPPMIKPTYLILYCDQLEGNVEVYKDGSSVGENPQDSFCGETFFVEGDKSKKCLGRYCDPGTGGCVSTPAAKDGECLDVRNYCDSLNTIQKAKQANVLGIPADMKPIDLNTIEPVYDTFCKTISDSVKTTFETNGQCAWWQSTGFLARKGGCFWYTQEFFVNNNICDEDTCEDFNSMTSNIIYSEPSADDFPACYHDWCNKGCEVTIVGQPVLAHYYCDNK